MIDLTKLTNDAIKTFEESGILQKAVSEAVENTIVNAVRSTFSEYSDFGKSIKEELKQKLNVNLDELNLQEHRQIVLNQLSSFIKQSVSEERFDNFNSVMKRITGEEIKNSYNLSELITQFKKQEAKHYGEYKSIALKIDRSTEGYVSIYFDNKKETLKHNCSHQVRIKGDGFIWNLKINSRDMGENKELGCLFNLDDLLFKMYAAGSRIILDNGNSENDYDTEYDYEEEE